MLNSHRSCSIGTHVSIRTVQLSYETRPGIVPGMGALLLELGRARFRNPIFRVGSRGEAMIYTHD